MKLSILGTGTALPDPERTSPGFVVQGDGGFLLMDPGPGSLQRMVRLGYDFRRLGHLLLTHFHCDHATDLISLFFARNVPSSSPSPRLTVMGPAGLVRYYEKMVAFLGHWVDQEDRIRLVELSPGQSTPIGGLGFRVRSEAVKHSGVCLGYRIEDESSRVLVYSGDTEWCPVLPDLVRDADLAVLECSSPSGQSMPGHLTPDEIARLALEAQPARILLTHLDPICVEDDLVRQVREAGYSGQVEVAQEGQTYSV